MQWEQRRESLCQRQRWHSGSWLHILCFSYLISKNTFFFFFAPGGLHVSGLHMCTCWFNTEAGRKHGHFVVSFYMNGHSHWKYTLPLHSRAFLCWKLFVHSLVMYSRGFYRCSISSMSSTLRVLHIKHDVYKGHGQFIPGSPPFFFWCGCSSACINCVCVGHIDVSQSPQSGTVQQ